MYQLYHEFAHRYDLHTPPGHYKHDHDFVIEEARGLSPACRLLDLGCGTGVFLKTALVAGLEAYGLDSSSEMVEVARRRVGADRVRVHRMQDITEQDAYNLVCSISWPIHYCETEEELADVVRRCRRALRPGGLLLLQVANEEQMDGSVKVDIEPGPGGEPGNTVFIHRFRPLRDRQHRVIAEYVYASPAYGELLCEQHELRFANPWLVAGILRAAGFAEVDVVSPQAVSPFVRGKRVCPIRLRPASEGESDG